MKTFARKIGMTQVYDKNGRHCAVTVLELLKTRVCAIKRSTDSHQGAVVYGLFDHGKQANKSTRYQFKEQSEGLVRVIEEKIKPNEDSEDIKLGEKITKSSFQEGSEITAFSRSKGKGFSGTVKRHGFQTGPKTHGSHNYRQPGSIGDTNPARVVKGKKMAGHMGFENKTTKNLEVIKIENDRERIWIKGALPGPNKSIVILEKHD